MSPFFIMGRIKKMTNKKDSIFGLLGSYKSIFQMAEFICNGCGATFENETEFSGYKNEYCQRCIEILRRFNFDNLPDRLISAENNLKKLPDLKGGCHLVTKNEKEILITLLKCHQDIILELIQQNKEKLRELNEKQTKLEQANEQHKAMDLMTEIRDRNSKIQKEQEELNKIQEELKQLNLEPSPYHQHKIKFNGKETSFIDNQAKIIGSDSTCAYCNNLLRPDNQYSIIYHECPDGQRCFFHQYCFIDYVTNKKEENCPLCNKPLFSTV